MASPRIQYHHHSTEACPECGLPRAKYPRSHDCVKQLKIEIESIKRQKTNIKSLQDELQIISKGYNSEIEIYKGLISDIRARSKNLASKCKYLERLLNGQFNENEEIKLDRAPYSEPQLSHQSLSIEEEKVEVVQPPRKIDVTKYAGRKGKTKETKREEKYEEDSKFQTESKAYLGGEEELKQQKLLIFEEELFEGVDQIKYDEEDDTKELIKLEDSEEQKFPTSQPNFELPQPRKSPIKIGHGYIEPSSPPQARLSKKERREQQKEEEEVKFQEVKVQKPKRSRKANNFFSFNQDFDDFKLPEIKEEKKEAKPKFKLHQLLNEVEIYEPVSEQGAVQQQQHHQLREYFQRNCSNEGLVQYSFGMPQKLLVDVYSHLEKLTKSIRDPMYARIGQSLSFVIITPKRESRFSFREMKGVLEEIDCFGFLNISREVGFYIVTSENIKNIKRAFGEAKQDYKFVSAPVDVDVLTAYWNQDPDSYSHLIRIPQSFEI